jgi:hypothetical protein
MPEKDFVGFRIDKIALLELDLQAEKLGLSRGEFICQAIAEKVHETDQLVDDDDYDDLMSKPEESDLVKLLACMNSVKSSIEETKTQDYALESYLYHAMINGFQNICAAIIAANPEDEQALKKLIKDSTTWERLNE